LYYKKAIMNKIKLSSLLIFFIYSIKAFEKNISTKFIELNEEPIILENKTVVETKSNNSHINFQEQSIYNQFKIIDNRIYSSSAITKTKCTLLNCLQENGLCIEEFICNCLTGFLNVEINTNIDKETLHYCNYQQKLQLIAFLLEFLIPIGAGHLYCNRFLYAMIKFIFIVILPCCICYFIYKCSQGSTYLETFVSVYRKNKSLTIAMNMWEACAVIWIVIDIILFGVNFFNDGNKLPLFPVFNLIDYFKK